MVNKDQVEKLCDYARISYADGIAAMEQTGGDVLEALIHLERLGKVRQIQVENQTSYSQIYSALFFL